MKTFLFMATFISIIIIMGVLLIIPVQAGTQDTGLHVQLRDKYGLELVDYDVTSKYKFAEDHFTVLDIEATGYGKTWYLTWIMPKEKYNELKEKV